MDPSSFGKFQKIGYSGIIPFVHVSKEEIHWYQQYEVSRTAHMGRIANQRKVPKWLPFEIYFSESPTV